MTGLLNGKTAIVTGGGKGIGRGISIAFAEAGAKVLLTGKDNMTMAEETRDIIRAAGGVAECLRADVVDENQVKNMVEEAVRLFGGVDILVNNAAYQPNLDINEYSVDDFDNVININLYGYMRCIAAALPYLQKSGDGRIINISSVHGKRPGGFDVAYSTSKGGIGMLTREAATEFKQYGINVNALLPGGTKIEFKSGVTHRFKFKRTLRDREFKRGVLFGLPEDTANIAVFIASPLAKHINGVAIRVDGGAMLF